MTGLESLTIFPNPRNHEQTEGRVALLQLGQMHEFERSLQFPASIRLAAQNVAQLQTARTHHGTIGWEHPPFTVD